MSKILKVLFIAADNSGPFFHDIHIPSNYFHRYNLLKCEATHVDLTPKSVGDHDIVVFQRQYAPEALLMVRALKDMGKICIFIIDDNVWELPKNNPAYKDYQGLSIERYQAILSECHAAWTSTEYNRIKGMPFNKNITVLRNLIEPIYTDFIKDTRDNPEEIRIGWTGTAHHYDDITYIEPALKKIANKYPQVKYVFMGFAPPHINEWLSRDRWEYYDFVQVDGFYPALANLDFDIGIAPLVDNGFNRGKTARKAQEYAQLKIPMVLADIVTYKDWKEDVTCLKAKNNKVDAWVYSLAKMIDDVNLRSYLKSNAYDYVMANHDIHKFILERASFFYRTWNLNKPVEERLEIPEPNDTLTTVQEVPSKS